MSGLSASRKAAFAILKAVEHGVAHSDDLLRGKTVSALSAPDRNLTTALVLGVLRWQIALDERIKAHLARPNARLEDQVRIALRLGAFQLLCLDRIPAHAAIDESVELTKQAGHRFASGMVNAVLRKLAREASAIANSPLSPEAAHPGWMVSRWQKSFGQQQTCSICSFDQDAPTMSVRLLDPEAELELKGEGVALSPAKLLASTRIIASGDVTSTTAFEKGRVRIQDEGSQLVAEIAAAAATGAKNILDACAAPGGKTMVLAERNLAAQIIACEISEPRFNQLRTRIAPLGDRIHCRLADAASFPPDEGFDLVLADVPCSGTGTLGRNPEIRHRLTPESIADQARRQGFILSACIRAVRPGARIVYSTCSIEPEENDAVVAAALASGVQAKPVPVSECLGHLLANGILTNAGFESLQTAIKPNGTLQLLPGNFGTDGFFVAVMEKL